MPGLTVVNDVKRTCTSSSSITSLYKDYTNLSLVGGGEERVRILVLLIVNITDKIPTYFCE